MANPNLRWAIMGTYRGVTEEVDSFDTRQEAEAMVLEYRLAFGPEWVLVTKAVPR